ncbi:MAG: response regulator [Endomicrobiales bacterium]|nr:response regulator [Endomicrobiales bacterium]
MKRILVADDDKNIQDTLENILKLEGYEVLTATTGEETIKKLKDEHLDLLILDLMMPEMDGASVSYDLKTRITAKKIPIIYISGMIAGDLAKNPAEGKENAVYLSKPFEIEKMLEIVARLTGETKG